MANQNAEPAGAAEGRRGVVGFVPRNEGSYQIKLCGTFKQVSVSLQAYKSTSYTFVGGWKCRLWIGGEPPDNEAKKYLWLSVLAELHPGSFKCECKTEIPGAQPIKKTISRSHIWTGPSSPDPAVKLGGADVVLRDIKANGDDLRIEITLISTAQWTRPVLNRTPSTIMRDQFRAFKRSKASDAVFDFPQGRTLSSSTAILEDHDYFSNLIEQHRGKAAETSATAHKRKRAVSKSSSKPKRTRRTSARNGTATQGHGASNADEQSETKPDAAAAESNPDGELDDDESATSDDSDAELDDHLPAVDEPPAPIRFSIDDVSFITFRAILDFLASGTIAFAPLKSHFEYFNDSTEDGAVMPAILKHRQEHRMVYGFGAKEEDLHEASPKSVFAEMELWELQEVAKRAYIDSLRPGIFVTEATCGLVHDDWGLQGAMLEYLSDHWQDIWGLQAFRQAVKLGTLPPRILEGVLDAAASSAWRVNK